MDKYIGFDIDGKKTVVCVVQKGGREKFTRLNPDFPYKSGAFDTDLIV